MGQNKKHMLGRDLKFFVTAETAYNPVATSIQTPVATDAMQVLSSSMEFTHERKDRADSRQTRSLLERITGRKEVSWSCESYVTPRGVATTAGGTGTDGVNGNDQHVLLRSSFGSSSVSGSGTRYDLTSTQVFPTMTLFREASEVGMEAVIGAYVEELKIMGSGGDEPKFSWSGTASKHIFTGTSEVTTGGTTTFEVATNECRNFEPGSLVKSTTSAPAVETATAVVQSVEVGGGTLGDDLVTLTATHTFTAASTITPYTPATTTTAQPPLNGISGSISLNAATDLPITAFEVTVTNNQKAINDEAFTDEVTDFIPGYRSVTGSLTVRARADQMKEIGMRKAFTSRVVTLVMGNAATPGGFVTIALGKVEFDSSAIEIPEAEEATFTLPFVAFGTSGDDEVTLTFD